ncbi:nitric oxide reductase [Achromatium sp. WMS1]|nr:nitric oxide reductase [Achromatium sp. WMS1]
MTLKYKSQAVARPYFVAAIVLFTIQILFGLILGLQYVVGDFLFPELPFNIARMVHTNTMIFWIMFGFMGAAYYMIPEEAETELLAPWLAWLIFWLFLFTILATIASYLFVPYARLVELTHDARLPSTMGREYMEQPTIAKLAISILSVLFLINIWGTTLKGRKTSINGLMLFGLFSSTLLFTLSFYNPTNLVLNKFYWWWTVHFWFEGTWAITMLAMLGFVFIRITGIDRDIIEKWLYMIATMIIVTASISIGRHYYWIGTPQYWQWWGSAFSLLQFIPLLMLASFGFNMIRNRQYEHPNKAALLWAIGSIMVSLLGAGFLGLLHKLAPINYYSHGTQIDVAYNHIAIYGAYAMTNLMMISYAMPIIRGQKTNSDKAQSLEMWSFWLMTISMTFMTVSLVIAGVLQIYRQRYTSIPQPFMAVQEHISFFYWLREFFGIIFLVGFMVYLYSIFIKPRICKNKDQS